MQMREYTTDAIMLDDQLMDDGLTRLDRNVGMDVWAGKIDGASWGGNRQPQDRTRQLQPHLNGAAVNWRNFIHRTLGLCRFGVHQYGAFDDGAVVCLWCLHNRSQ